MRAAFAVCIALLTAQCTTAPTAEEVQAQRAKWEQDCKARGFTPGTQDFEACIATGQAQSNMHNAALAGATLGLAPLLSGQAGH